MGCALIVVIFNVDFITIRDASHILNETVFNANPDDSW
jgi:hypothetical protein